MMDFIRWLKNMEIAPKETSVQAYKTVIKELIEYFRRYRWHDLRKNPEDLPPGGEYWCLVQLRNPYYEAYHEDKVEIIEYAYDVIDFHRGKFMKGESKYYIRDIIAWKEIEPF